MKVKHLSKLMTAVAFTLSSVLSMAQEKTPVEKAPSALSSPALYIMLAVILVLLLSILAMGESIKAAANYKRNKHKNSDTGGTTLKTVLLLVCSLAASGYVTAQTVATTPVTETVTKSSDYWGMDPGTFFALSAIILFELVVWWILRNISMQLLCEGLPEKTPDAKEVIKISLTERFNASVAIEKEEEIMLDHDYDGIRELDNDLPPWWKYGFYASIVFSCVYLVHYHITKTGKLQIAEYESEMKQAAEALAEYREKAADMVDENNAAPLTDETSLNAGKTIFMDNCAACHGKLGEGGVGPNLTDDYWLHSGSIQAVFKSVKYGWPEKGMKAWQQDLSPKQIHQVSSFIKSLRGTNPPNAKEKQGELYIEKGAASDTLKTDSTAVISIK